LAAVLKPRREPLEAALAEFQARLDFAFPGQLRPIAETLIKSAGQTLESMQRFEATAFGSQDFMEMHKALRGYNLAIAPLYLLAPLLSPVSSFFLETPLAGSNDYVAALRQGLVDAARNNAVRGVVHNGNESNQRGGYSLFVPENYNPDVPAPLVVALHGGSGHGRDFLWNWLPEARSRGVMVLSPTAQERTWSIIEPPDVDQEPLLAMVTHVREHFSVDPSRILLTGMSDGATYTLMLGLRDNVPFTHLAPVCGVLHPVAIMDGSLANARGMAIYQVNGVIDWMFPIQTAHMARDHLTEAGARLTFRAIEDLAHTYPRDENPNILDWFGAPLPLMVS
jgi:phospholipase/carboxylesterase